MLICRVDLVYSSALHAELASLMADSENLLKALAKMRLQIAVVLEKLAANRLAPSVPKISAPLTFTDALAA
jgi:hypothetical protein